MAGKKGNSGENSGGELIPQEHGGALLAGGVPGNKGGPGRPPSAIRGELRAILEDSLDTLKRFSQAQVQISLIGVCDDCGHESDAGKLPVTIKGSDVTKAIDIAAKYGLGKPPKYDEELIKELHAVVDELAPELSTEIAQRWVQILASRATA